MQLEENIKEVMYDKFIESYHVKDYEVLTPKGWINIEGIGKTILFDEFVIKTSGDKELICADKHIMYRCDNIIFDTKKCDLTEIYCENLGIGDIIMTKDGPEMIMEYYKNGKSSNMYDIQLSEGSNKQYFTNGILSHNSIWMQNFAVGSANAGHNVLYITLEMSEKKVLKRMGAMRLKIPINEYDNLSMDKDFIKGKINNLNKSGSGNINDLFENKVGKIRVKFWSAGIATVAHIDNLLADYLSKMNMKFDMLVVDYLTLLAPPKGADTLYIKGKVIAEGLRALAAKYQLAVISATQIDKDMWGADSIDISSGSESKSIPETCDTMWGIIRSEEMKRNNKYRLKLLKQRDGSFDKSMIMFDLNPVYLSIENEMFLDQI